MLSLNEALERMQRAGEERAARVTVTPSGKMFTVTVDGVLVLGPAGKPRKFRDQYNAKQHGKSVTWDIDDAKKAALR